MIRNSFIFLPGILEKAEQNIWHQGIRDWDAFLKAKEVRGIGKKRKGYYDRLLIEAKNQLYNFNSSFFIDKLPSTETYRLWKFFYEDAIFLDIEIVHRGDIIVIGLFDGTNTKIMVKGINLDQKLLLTEINNAKILITFNGSSFDIPTIEKFFKIKLNIPHIDLRHCCTKLGLTGGLKEIESRLGISRQFKGSPSDAWKAYLASGDQEYLERIVAYNEEDIINLLPLMRWCYDRLYLLFKEI